MKVRELVEELKKCNKRMKVVFIDDENKELKLDTKVQVDDGGWDQLTFITEEAYEDEIGSKKFSVVRKGDKCR